MELGTRVKTMREQMRLSQVDLAKMAGVGSATIVRLETGQRRTHMSKLEKIAKVLGVSVASLLDEDPLPVQPQSEEQPQGVEKTLGRLCTAVERMERTQILEDRIQELERRIADMEDAYERLRRRRH